MAPKSSRRIQPDGIKFEEIANVLHSHLPPLCKQAARSCGRLVDFKPVRKNGVVDRTNLEIIAPLMEGLLHLNPSGIFKSY